jgi:uncharacterized protein (DUF1778 family)
MTLEFTHEEQTLLAQAAADEGTSLSDYVTKAALWRAHQSETDRASLRRGIEQANRGEFIEEEEMDRRFARMLGEL